MQRPLLVYVGGSEEQPIECLYLGVEGDKAQEIFDAAAQDGANDIVRFCHYPEHTQIRTPSRDGVPVREKAEPVSSVGAPPTTVPTTNGAAQGPDPKAGSPGPAPQTSAVPPAENANKRVKTPGAPDGPDEAFDA